MSDLSRYSRQMLFPAIGEEGQRRILASRVAILGCGATGTVIANHLARAGVGHLRIVDRDFVELTNLQRQTLFEEADAREGFPKAIAAQHRLRAINAAITVEGQVADVNAGNIEKLIADADLVLDGTDNFETRYVINDACVKHGKPWVYTGVVSSYGMTHLIRPGETPCLRCLFPEPPPPGGATCDTAGVLAPAVGMVCALSATEALKWLAGAHDELTNALVHVDVWDATLHRFDVKRRVGEDPCPCCVQRQFPFLEVSATSHASSLCGRNAIQITLTRPARLSLPDLAERLRPMGEVTVNPFLLKFQVGEYQLTIFPDARAIIQGTTDESVARTLYARYVGV